MISDYRTKLSIDSIFRVVWRGKLWLAALAIAGAFAGLELGKRQTPVYRVEYIVTRNEPGAIAAFREPFLKLLPLTVAPIYYPLVQKGAETKPEEGSFDFIAPTSDGLFEKYLFYMRTLQGLEATFRDPVLVAKGREHGLDAARWKRLRTELLDQIRFLNLGVNFERTRVVLVGKDIPLLEAITLAFLRHTDELVVADVRRELQGRVDLIRRLITYRMAYLKSLGAAAGSYGVLVEAEKKLLEADLKHTEEARNAKFDSQIYTLADDGSPTIVLLRPKPRLYAAICGVAGALIAVWLLLLVEILKGTVGVTLSRAKGAAATAE
jgi:hypothetical protein